MSRLELEVRPTVVKALVAYHGFPVENPAKPGTPDIYFIHGWIELKVIDAWPKRESTVVKIDHYTVQQRSFARVHMDRGGNVLFLLKIGTREWLLMDGAKAARMVGSLTRPQLIEQSLKHWTSGFRPTEFTDAVMDFCNANAQHTGRN